MFICHPRILESIYSTVCSTNRLFGDFWHSMNMGYHTVTALTFRLIMFSWHKTCFPTGGLQTGGLKYLKAGLDSAVICALDRFSGLIYVQIHWGNWTTGLEMATDTVANATKMVHLATRSFQAVAKLATSSKLTTKLKTKDVSDCD